MLPVRSSSPALRETSVALLERRNEEFLTDGNKETQDSGTSIELNSKAQWVTNWLLLSTTERNIPENELSTFPGPKSLFNSSNEIFKDNSVLDGAALRNTLLLDTGAITDEELSKKNSNLQCLTQPRLTFDSVDSSASGVSHGSFRIGANRDTPVSLHTGHQRQETIEKKLLAAGIIENCTQVLEQLMSPSGDDSAVATLPTHPAFIQALSNEDATAVMKVIVATVSMGIDLKSSRIGHQLVQQRLKTVARRERQLECLKARLFRESRNPEELALQRGNREMEKTIAFFSAHNFQLKRSIREVAIEVENLREAEKDATVTARRLYDCKEKYIKISDENRDLNRVVQKLQGDVRVFCQLSKPPRTAIGYLASSNRGEVTLQQKQKVRTFTVDAVITGPPTTSSLRDDIKPMLSSVLDGFDSTVISMGARNGATENTTIAGIFVPSLACMISTLLTTANGRFYHESYMFEFEIILTTETGSHILKEKTNLTTAMVASDKKGLLDTSADGFDRINKLLTDIFSRQDLEAVQQGNVQMILRLTVQRKYKPTNTRSTSEITFIQVYPATNGRWMQDQGVTSLVSALINISSGKPQANEDIDSPVVKELYRPANNHRLYLLFVQLENEPVHEKTNLAALSMCNDVIQARTIKDPQNGWNGPGQKKIVQLEKAIGEKDKLICSMTSQQDKVEKNKLQLEGDIEKLRAEISALKAAKSTRDKEKASKPSHPKANVGTKQEETTSRLRKTSKHLDIKEHVLSKSSSMPRCKTDPQSRIPLPRAKSVTSENGRVSHSGKDVAMTIKTHVKREEMTTVTKILRPPSSKLANLCRDSSNKIRILKRS